MDSNERREKGAHYTAEKNILKLIRPLFLDELRAEFDAARANKSTRRTARLKALQIKLGTPTCIPSAILARNAWPFTAPLAKSNKREAG